MKLIEILSLLLVFAVAFSGCGKKESPSAKSGPPEFLAPAASTPVETVHTPQHTGPVPQLQVLQPFDEDFQNWMSMGSMGGMTCPEVKTGATIGNIGTEILTFDKVVEKFYSDGKLRGTTIVTFAKKYRDLSFTTDPNPSFDVPAGMPIELKPHEGIKFTIKSANSQIGALTKAQRKVVVTAMNKGKEVGRFTVPIMMANRKPGRSRSSRL